MLIPGGDFLPQGTITRGNYIFGLSNGTVVLRNMQHGDTAEISRSQMTNGVILTFEPFWSRIVKKQYTFLGQCKTIKERLERVIDSDIAYMTRLWTHEMIEYGYIDPDGTSISNMTGNTFDFSLMLISIYEVPIRKLAI